MTTNNHRDTMPEPRPLWEVMQSAYIAGCKPGCGYRLGYAAEIRAIADAVVPEEPNPDAYTSIDIVRRFNTSAMLRWEQRMATRALLLAEAERAEQGDDVQRHLDDFQNRHAADFQALAGE